MLCGRGVGKVQLPPGCWVAHTRFKSGEKASDWRAGPFDVPSGRSSSSQDWWGHHQEGHQWTRRKGVLILDSNKNRCLEMQSKRYSNLKAMEAFIRSSFILLKFSWLAYLLVLFIYLFTYSLISFLFQKNSDRRRTTQRKCGGRSSTHYLTPQMAATTGNWARIKPRTRNSILISTGGRSLSTWAVIYCLTRHISGKLN